MTPEEHEKIAEENRKAVEKANEAAVDWRCRCRKCGQKLKGSLAKLRAHKC